MARKHLFELLSEREFDVPTEFHNLQVLFSEEKCIFDFQMYTVQQYIDEYAFRELPMSGTFLSIKDMRAALEIPSSVGKRLDQLFLFCEMIYNLILGSRRKLPVKDAYKYQSAVLVKNINLILNKTGYRWLELEGHEFIIVEDNKTALEAAELVEDETAALQILEYNHYALEGNLEEKKRILCALGQYLEPILKERTGTAFDEIVGDAKFLLNNFHIRHNNKAGSKANDYVQSVTDEQLERWYDRTYAALIGTIVMNEWKDMHAEIKELKKNYAWKQ